MNTTSPEQYRELVASVIECLSDGERLLSGINAEDYTRKLPVAFNASVGGHYRHCLDHFQSVLQAASGGDLNYDLRERGTAIETDCFAALVATRQLREAFAKLDPRMLARSLSVTCQTSHATDGSQVAESSIGREIMYSVSHAVHHYALIGIMAGIMGLTLPQGFGVAPSTLKHQAEAARAAA
jgi:hypothetical protein